MQKMIAKKPAAIKGAWVRTKKAITVVLLKGDQLVLNDADGIPDGPEPTLVVSVSLPPLGERFILGDGVFQRFQDDCQCVLGHVVSPYA